jgi:hypothetical protein
MICLYPVNPVNPVEEKESDLTQIIIGFADCLVTRGP